MTIKAKRYHDISMGHRVVGHESKCAHLHGHNYRIHFTIESPELDDVGRVLDFSVIKQKLCMWLEDKWDHKFLAYEEDPVMQAAYTAMGANPTTPEFDTFADSIVWVPFNPTAENMAEYLVVEVGPLQLRGTGCRLTEVTIEETRKCSCSFSI